MRQITIYTLLLLVISAISEVYASAPPLLDWQKCIGGSGLDMPVKVIRSQDGSLLMIGSTGSSDGNISLNHGSSDVWLCKTDSAGQLLWEKTFGGSNNDIGTGIIQLSNGDLILSGYTASYDGDVSNQHGNFDCWIIKTNASGSIIWEKTFGGSLVDLCYAIIKTSDGGILIGGGTYSNDGDVSGAHGDQDFWLLKVDANGNIDWQRTLGGSGLDVCYAIGEINANEIIACGSSNSVDGDVNGQHGGSDFWVVKLNAGGTILWDRCFGGSDQEAALTLACNNTSGILVSGYSRSINGDLHQNFGYNDMWSILLDQNGSLVSQKILGGPGTDISFSAIGTLDGGFLLAGGTTSQSGDITFNYGQEDIWLTKLDQNLNTEWEKSYGGSRNERPSSLVQTPDGGFVFSGYSYSNDGNVSGNHGSADYWIVHLSCTQPDAIFSTPYDSLCTGMTAFFSNHSLHSAAYSWTANQQFVSTSEDVSILLSAPGMYNVSLIAQTCYASDTLQQLISAIAPPEIKVSTSQSHLCIGDSIELSVAGGNSCLWNTGETTSSIYVHSRGPFVATVNYSGCPSSSSPVYLNATAKPTLNLGADTAICTGTSLLLQVAFTSGLSFLWQDGSTLSSYSVSQPGNYCVQVSDAHCFSRDTIRVDTFNCSSPTASFTVATQQICEHGTVSFLNNSSQASSWIWSFPGGNPANSTLENPVIRYDAAGTYSVTLTVSNGQQTQTLMRWNYIVVNALPDRPQIEVNGFLLSTSTAYTYQWFLNSTAIAGAGSEYYLASVDGFYQVSITDSHQCSALSDSVYLSVTGTDKTDHGTEMRVFPNPVNDQLHCTIKKLTNETGLLRILDVQGRALIRREITEVGSIADFTFDLSALPSGLYILDFTGISVTRFQYKIQKL